MGVKYEMIKDLTPFYYRKTAYQLIKTVAKLMKESDAVTGMHLENTGILAAEFTKHISGLNEAKIAELVLAANLHDIGKLMVDKKILCNVGVLSKEEFTQMKLHTVNGAKLYDSIVNEGSCRCIYENRTARDVILYHHEWWNGNGYPAKLRNGEIPYSARIMAICDVYDALVTERPYKKAYSNKEALMMIDAGRGRQFDPELTNIFVKYSNDILMEYEKKKEKVIY